MFYTSPDLPKMLALHRISQPASRLLVRFVVDASVPPGYPVALVARRHFVSVAVCSAPVFLCLPHLATFMTLYASSQKRYVCVSSWWSVGRCLRPWHVEICVIASHFNFGLSILESAFAVRTLESAWIESTYRHRDSGKTLRFPYSTQTTLQHTISTNNEYSSL